MLAWVFLLSHLTCCCTAADVTLEKKTRQMDGHKTDRCYTLLAIEASNEYKTVESRNAVSDLLSYNAKTWQVGYYAGFHVHA